MRSNLRQPAKISEARHACAHPSRSGGRSRRSLVVVVIIVDVTLTESGECCVTPAAQGWLCRAAGVTLTTAAAPQRLICKA